MKVQENIPLNKLNTFGINVNAKYFAPFKSLEELHELLAFKKPQTPSDRVSRAGTNPVRPGQPGGHKLQTLILGGGSNILFTKDYDGLVLKNEIAGIQTIKEDQNHIYVKAGAGENWSHFVSHCIKMDWAGVENLSGIPGNVGAAPIQNIGAYGVEMKSVFYCLEAFHLTEKKLVEFSVNDCEFSYRDSIFKRRYRDMFVITSVTYRLNKEPAFTLSYGSVEEELKNMGVSTLSIGNVSRAILNIRNKKLPQPSEIGNAGSFFKNPHIDAGNFNMIKDKYPNLVGYLQPEGDVKLAAGWLIEHCGPKGVLSWKGYRKGDAGCHSQQSLVLVNYGHASGKEIFDLSEEIIQSVKEKFGVVLEREVNMI